MKDFISGALTAYCSIAAVVAGIVMAILIWMGEMTWSIDAVPQVLACIITGAIWPAVMVAEIHDLDAVARFVATFWG